MTTPPNTQPDAAQIVAELRAGQRFLKENKVGSTAKSWATNVLQSSPDRIAILLDAFDAQAKEIAELREIVDGLLAQIAAVHGSDGYRNMQEIMRVNNAVLAENYELVKENATLRAKENLNV